MSKIRVDVRDGLCVIELNDPPANTYSYEMMQEIDAALLVASEWVTPGGRMILEHSRRREAPEDAATFRRGRVVIAGDSALSFYSGA